MNDHIFAGALGLERMLIHKRTNITTSSGQEQIISPVSIDRAGEQRDIIIKETYCRSCIYIFFLRKVSVSALFVFYQFQILLLDLMD